MSFQHQTVISFYLIIISLIKVTNVSLAEDQKLLRIVLVKSLKDPSKGWMSLLIDQYQADPLIYNEMEKKLTLERFQKEVNIDVIIFCNCEVHSVFVNYAHYPMTIISFILLLFELMY